MKLTKEEKDRIDLLRGLAEGLGLIFLLSLAVILPHVLNAVGVI